MTNSELVQRRGKEVPDFNSLESRLVGYEQEMRVIC